ncbi:MAG: HTTM domain-containing protein [Myxococcales bacterium]|nr:HTTM domain-containing protein [Myxococcales bacterium]
MTATSSARALLSRPLRWALYDCGSTRPLGLIRIGVALMLWARFGDLVTLHADATAAQLAHGVGFYLGTTLLLVGLATRPAALLSALAVAYGKYALDWQSHNMQLLALTTMILALTPCGRSYSLDRGLALRRAARRGEPPPVERAPLWSARLLAVLITSVYMATAYDKTSWAFLSGERLAAVAGFHYTGSAYLDGTAWVAATLIASALVWALELTLAFGLYLPRLRPALTLAGAALHGSFYALFRVYTFSTNMLLLYAPFYDQDELARGIERLCPRGPRSAAEPSRRPPGRARSLARAAGVALVLLALVAAAAYEHRVPSDVSQETEINGDEPPRPQPRLRLLEGRWRDLGATREEARRRRQRQTRREMQKWRGA